MSKNSRRKFTAEFKSKVCVEAIKERQTVEALAKKYDLHPTQINTWKKEFLQNSSAAFAKDGNSSGEDNAALIQALYAQIGELKVANDFLKKALVKSVEERRMLVETDHQQLSIVKQCELLQISRSGFYYQPVPESKENLAVMRWLDEQYFKTPFYGVERLLVVLVVMGYNINHKRLRRLMKLQGWQTLYPKPRTTRIDPAAYKYPYLLKNVYIERKNQAWAIDITYVPMKNGFMYLCAVIDLHTRYVVNWGISNSMTAEWCTDIVLDAIAIHGKPEIVNSDQGSQFTSEVYVNMLKANEVQISMDGKGRAIDNIFVERLWRTVKYEHIYLYAYEDGWSLYNGLQKYFSFYNGERRHQSLNNETPENCFLKSAA